MAKDTITQWFNWGFAIFGIKLHHYLQDGLPDKIISEPSAVWVVICLAIMRKVTWEDEIQLRHQLRQDGYSINGPFLVLQYHSSFGECILQQVYGKYYWLF